MAGKGKPGPAKGHGGRPRKPQGSKTTAANPYKRVTVGKKGKGHQTYLHRVRAGVAGDHPGRGSKKVVDHIDKVKSDDRRKNLRVISRGKNTARSRKGGKS